MSDIATVIIITLIVSYFCWSIISFDKRINKKILKDAIKRGVKIDKIREPNLADGENPLSKTFNNLSGFDLLSAPGENKHYRLIETADSIYWVRVYTNLYIPNKIEWSKKL